MKPSRALLVLLVLLAGCGSQPASDSPRAVGSPFATSSATAAGPTASPVATAAPSATPALKAPSETTLPLPPSAVSAPVPDPSLAREAAIGGRVFQLEVARTPAERARGLMGRPSLSPDVAMLFVYDREDYLVFWMKETLIPLEILFLDAEGVVVDVQAMEPQPGVPDAVLRRYRSARPAQFALEMNAGLVGRYGIAPGVRVEFR
ncbi:MAG: DUF192 domain-containing protein [Chloroflexi bacterium]|nr:DUF192 domain-containing protein [Chloroflexota bacterium]